MALLQALTMVAAALPGQLVDESFESGDLDAGWTYANTVPGITLSVTSAAAHRGQYGLRVSDTETTLKGAFGTYVQRTLDGGPPTNVYSRLWIRFASYNRMGGGIEPLTLICQQSAVIGSLQSFNADFFLDYSLIVQPIAPDGTSSYAATQGSVGIGDGGWHLVEISTVGIFTDAGRDIGYVDGVDAGEIDGLGQFPNLPSKVMLGEFWADNGGTGGFAGVYDMDDLRVDSSPLPSALVLSGPPSVAQSACFAVSVSLSSSMLWPDGGPATQLSAPYDVSLSLGGGAFFTDSTCSEPTAQPVLSRAANGVTLYAQVLTAGTATLTAEQAPVGDFLPAALTLSVTLAPDAGTASDAGPGESANQSYYAINCGSVPGGFEALLALLILSLPALLRARAATRKRSARR